MVWTFFHFGHLEEWGEQFMEQPPECPLRLECVQDHTTGSKKGPPREHLAVKLQVALQDLVWWSALAA